MPSPLYSGRPLDLSRRHFINTYPPFNVAKAGSDPLAAPRRELLVYVHVPFCPTLCTYCFFKKFGNPSTDVLATYVEYLKREIALFAARPDTASAGVKTLYIGGGTPTVLSAAQLADVVSVLRERFDCTRLEEFCCEIMPHEATATRDKLESLRDLGVTRVSFGVETFDEELLRLHNRPCTRDLYERTYRMVRDIGFRKVNVDVMSGLAGATWQTWTADIDALLAWAPPSVSIYKTEVFYNTPMFAAMRSGARPLSLLTDAEELAHIRYAHETLQRERGYVVANCLQLLRAMEYDDVHYRSIWLGGELKGFGLSAHSSFGNVLHQNVSALPAYYGMLDAGRLPIGRAHRLTARDRISRAMVYGLKTLAVSRTAFLDEFGMDLADVYGPVITDLLARGAVTLDDKHLRIAPAFQVFADDICRQFFLPEYDGMIPAHVARDPAPMTQRSDTTWIDNAFAEA